MIHGSALLLRRAGAIATALVVLSTLFAPAAMADDPPGTVAYATKKALFSVRVDEVEGPVTTELFRQKGIDPCCPVFSPDGTKVMFLAFEGSEASLKVYDRGSDEVYTIAGKKFYPDLGSWSPDGSMIAFQALAKEKKGVYIAGALPHGGKVKVFQKRIFASPNWSYDGQKVAFAYARKNNKGRIVYHDLNTNELYDAPITPALDAFSPEWSPTAEVLSFEAVDQSVEPPTSSIYTVDVAAEDAVPVALTGEGENGYAPEWALDGSVIIFDSVDTNDHETIVSVAPDGTGRTDLVSDNDSETVNSIFVLHGYSPDGSKIAYTSYDFNDDAEMSEVQVNTMDADGGNQVERTIGDNLYFVDWAADSDSLLICEEDVVEGRSNLLLLMGESYTPLASDLPFCDAQWGASLV